MIAGLITASEHEGKTYYTAVSRGVEYTACPSSDGRYWVASRRLSLGRWNTGGGKYYENLEAVAQGCKAFTCLDALVNS